MNRARSMATMRPTCRDGTFTVCRSASDREDARKEIKKLAPASFRQAFASKKWSQVIIGGFNLLVVMGDGSPVYTFCRNSSETTCLRQIIRNGHGTGLKPVHCCPDWRSALAEAESSTRTRHTRDRCPLCVIDVAELSRRFGARRCATRSIALCRPRRDVASNRLRAGPEIRIALDRRRDAGSCAELPIRCSHGSICRCDAAR